MAWVKLDDHFDEHPKLAALSDSAFALWVSALAYCNRNLTDGFVPAAVAARGRGGTPAAEELVESGLWKVTDRGFQIHDFLTFQPSRSKVVAGRDAARERMRAARLSGSREHGANGARSFPNPDPVPDTEPSGLGSSDVELDKTPTSDSVSIKTVYDHWRSARSKNRVTYERISDGRRRKIRARLREFTVDELCSAIDGVAKDTWEDRPLHDDLTVIFRSREQVEKFLEMGQHVRVNGSPSKRAEAWVRQVGWQYPDADLFEELSKMGLEGEERKRIAALAVSLQEMQ